MEQPIWAFLPSDPLSEKMRIIYDMMTTLKEANLAFEKKCAEAKVAGKEKVFETPAEMEDFFRPFFQNQRECKDLTFWLNIFSAHRQYGFIGGGIIGTGGGTIEIK